MSKQKVMKGINDVATSHPQYVKYFKNINDAYTCTYGQSKKVDLICPICGFEKASKVSNLIRYGFVCPYCYDGFSYPEKFIMYFLKHINVKFVHQLSKTYFNWCKNKRYDFYLPDYNCIIETHGRQHYEEANSFKKH